MTNNLKLFPLLHKIPPTKKNLDGCCRVNGQRNILFQTQITYTNDEFVWLNILGHKEPLRITNLKIIERVNVTNEIETIDADRIFIVGLICDVRTTIQNLASIPKSFKTFCGSNTPIKLNLGDNVPSLNSDKK